MRRNLLPLLLALLSIPLAAFAAPPTGPAPQGRVALKVDYAREQPNGGPILVEVILTNEGDKPISWWSGGPDKYPGAQYFAVEVRYGVKDEWVSVKATNGQYVQGSGTDRKLPPGQSIVVPLAIPVQKVGKRPAEISFRISAGEWKADQPIEGYVSFPDRREPLDNRRTRVLTGVIDGTSPFLTHVAFTYPDEVVTDVLLKLMTIDNVQLVARTAVVLARCPKLPESAGPDFAAAVARWVPQAPDPTWGGLREDVAACALKTETEAGRKAVLDLLQNPSAEARLLAVYQLRNSPGDKEWLRRALAAVSALKPVPSDDPRLPGAIKSGIEWLQSRMKNHDLDPR
jgi:hypothetical protein